MTLKDKLKKKRVPVADINVFMAYIQGEKNKERNKEKKPVTKNSDDMLYTLFIRFWNMGLIIDGVNVVITGYGMAMVTFHGYKNKVKQTYPTATFDIQLVREGDTFNVAKESGEIIYSHQIDDPFSNNEIKGAYVVVDIDGKQYFEALNKEDYFQMKKGSKMPGTWDKWASEFWLKSVMKRACKRHFYDVVADIDQSDNDDYGMKDDVKATEEKKSKIIEAKKNDTNTTDTAE